MRPGPGTKLYEPGGGTFVVYDEAPVPQAGAEFHVAQAGLLAHLPPGGLLGRLARLDLAPGGYQIPTAGLSSMGEWNRSTRSAESTSRTRALRRSGPVLTAHLPLTATTPKTRLTAEGLPGSSLRQ